MKILIVEDEADIAELMMFAVREYIPQTEVVVAMTCERAVEELRRDTGIDLVFTDFMGGDGCTVIKECLKLGIRVVACTGKILDSPADICFVELLQKPFNLKELERFLS